MIIMFVQSDELPGYGGDGGGAWNPKLVNDSTDMYGRTSGASDSSSCSATATDGRSLPPPFPSIRPPPRLRLPFGAFPGPRRRCTGTYSHSNLRTVQL